MDLITQARQYLDTQRGNWPTVAQEAGVGYQWLIKFAQGHIDNPGARQIDALLKHRDRAAA